jgi:capsular exopolysaccharide synthesis family protein
MSSPAPTASAPSGAGTAGDRGAADGPGAALPDLVTVAAPRSAAAEAYRTLRTNLQFSSVERPVKRLLLTSSGPDEGKSTTVANLAVVMAQAELRVVAVDCDLRRPSLHEVFGLSNNEGLSSLFLTRPSVGGAAPAIQPLLRQTAVAGLSVLTSGPLPPNPAELLGSARMDAILDALDQHADAVLLDSPPVVAVTDAAVLSAKVDGVLLVVGAGIVKRDLARKAKALLETVHANVLGIVVNNVPPDSDTFVPYGAEGGA